MIAPTWLRISAPSPTPSAANSAQAAVLPAISLMISLVSLPVADVARGQDREHDRRAQRGGDEAEQRAGDQRA